LVTLVGIPLACISPVVIQKYIPMSPEIIVQ
jgi:hypothetical protein